MTTKENKPVARPEGEISEQQLDNVSGGQEVVKLGKITVTAKREQPQQIVKLDKVVVTAKREPPLAGSQIASATTKSKTN